MRTIIALLGLALVSTSCGIYQSSFDCPAGKGVGCKSVNEVMQMIVEKDNGEDLFVPDADQKKKIVKKKKKCCASKSEKTLVLRKEHGSESVLVEEGN